VAVTTSAVRFFSEALGRDSMLTVLQPDHCDRPLGVANNYEEFPGGHTWDYWRANFDKTLQFTLDLFRGL
jgi:S-formylglutathione hydrolase FrmB